MSDNCKLRINETARGFRIAWWFPEDEDFGASIGETGSDGTGEKPQDYDEAESWVAARAILDLYPDTERDENGFHFDSSSQAKKALTTANAALKAHRSTKPYPEWATLALQHGWKPPKGWKP